MAKFLVVHSGYTQIGLGIFDKDQSLNSVILENKSVSKEMLNSISSLLSNLKLNLDDIDFIAAHQGPAPFTTLRVALATVNGISYATKIPLVGVNGIKNFLEYNKKEEYTTLALLNAFSNELYYAITNREIKEFKIGYAPALELLQNISNQYQGKIFFIGNGTKLFLKEIQDIFKDRAIIGDDLLGITSINNIAKAAYLKWQNQEYSRELMPVYLKTASKINL